MSEFSRYWDDIKKHEKRVYHWLPHVKQIFSTLGPGRAFRYFTLCATTMIDVFMLVRERVLTKDAQSGAIPGVQFCECVSEDFTAIRDLIAVENSGFLGKLEDIALFEDDGFTLQYPTARSIEEALVLEDIAADERGERLRLKQRHAAFKTSFPFDYVNLDFCEQYYEPPEFLKVGRTVEKFLDWQRNASFDGISVDTFTMAITCRLDTLPTEVTARLVALLNDNSASSPRYSAGLRGRLGTRTISEWAAASSDDFFMSAWPKDVAASAKSFGWKTEVLDYVYYSRTAKDGSSYWMICLVTRFSRDLSESDYVAAALHALDLARRKYIEEHAIGADVRVALRKNLAELVEMRNAQAKAFSRSELLPYPRA